MQPVNLSITTALCELQEIVASVEDTLTLKEPNAIKQAKERYLNAAQTLKSLTDQLHLPTEDIPGTLSTSARNKLSYS